MNEEVGVRGARLGVSRRSWKHVWGTDWRVRAAALHVRYVSTVSGPRADTELYPLYLDRDTVIQYVLYLIVSGLEADTEWIHCIIQQIHCIVHVGP